MSVYHLKRFSNPQVLLELDPRYLNQLLARYRDYFAKRHLSIPEQVEEVIDCTLLAEILLSPDGNMPKELVEALYFIHEMSTFDACEVLLRDCEALGIDTGKGLFKLTAADIAVRVWLRDPNALQRRHAELQSQILRRFQYFQINVPMASVFAAPNDQHVKKLELALDEAFRRKGRGRGTHVFCCPSEHDCLFIVRHGEPHRREGAMIKNKPSSVLFQPLRFDVVGYDIRSQTLRVHATRRWETTLYRQQFGLHLFGSMRAFAEHGRYTLEPLQTQKVQSLCSTDVDGMRKVTLTEVQINRGGSHGLVETWRATNLFQAMLAQHRELPADVALVSATFEVQLYNDAARRMVRIEPPNIAHYSRDEDSYLIDQWLRKRGFIQTSEAEENRGAQSASVLQSA